MNAETANPRQSQAYLKDGRLEDVLALIQFLGLTETTQRIESTIQGKRGLLSKPLSAASWTEIARTHCEFFRVYDGDGGPVISLILREFLPPADRKMFPPEFVNGLMESAIRMHETQLQRRQILKVAWAGGILLALSSLASLVSAIVAIWKH